MIRVAGQDRHGPIDLFGEQDARQLVRKCGRAEGNNQLGFLADLLAETIGAADEEYRYRRVLRAEGGELGGKRLARQTPAAAVERDEA